MRPVPFDYIRPSSVQDACVAVADGGTVLAGGQSLLPLLKLRTVRPTLLVDVNRLACLHGIERGDGGLVIGATTRHQQVATDALVADAAPLLADAAGRIGDVQVRARGTIGGNVCFADPRANMSTALVALGAVAVIRGETDSRHVVVEELLAGDGVRSGELLTEFHVPAGSGRYLEVSPQPNGVPIVGVAVARTAHGLRVAIGGLLRSTCRARPVEEGIAEGATQANIRRGVDRLLADYEAYVDARGDDAYRARVATVLVGRALATAEV